jgi:tRNA (mo5U34)-methyltransferase
VLVHELQARIAEFPRWHYEFQFANGITTPIHDRRHVNRQEQRRRYFFESLLQVTGGSLRGRRVLDLGCNAGFWCLQAIEAGADFALGVDGRQMHIEQARLVFEAKGVDPARYRFEQGNVFEHAFAERFDVVLCLGLLYHVSKPIELLELIASVGAQIIVMDTNIFPAPFNFFRVRHESVEAAWHAVDYELVMVPTRQAVISLCEQFGFKTVPLALNMTDNTGMDDYREQRRLAFIGSKSATLAGLARETRPPLTPAAWPWVLGQARRRLRTRRHGPERV